MLNVKLIDLIIQQCEGNYALQMLRPSPILIGLTTKIHHIYSLPAMCLIQLYIYMHMYKTILNLFYYFMSGTYGIIYVFFVCIIQIHLTICVCPII